MFHSLLKAHAVEARYIVREALEILTPAMPGRMEDGNVSTAAVKLGWESWFVCWFVIFVVQSSTLHNVLVSWFLVLICTFCNSLWCSCLFVPYRVSWHTGPRRSLWKKATQWRSLSTSCESGFIDDSSDQNFLTIIYYCFHRFCLELDVSFVLIDLIFSHADSWWWGITRCITLCVITSSSTWLAPFTDSASPQT